MQGGTEPPYIQILERGRVTIMKKLSQLTGKALYKICIILLFLMGCTDIKTIPLSANTSFDKIKDLTKKEISVYKKYDDMLKQITNDLKACAPVGQNVPEGILKFTGAVVSYGEFLEKTDIKDYNTLTIHNPAYWNAFFALITNDATVLFTREFFLMREGLLDQAEVVLFFALMAKNNAYERDRLFIQTVEKDITSITASSNNYVKKGIEFWDKGKQEKAHELYYNSLAIYPKNPWPIYELNLSGIFNNMENIAGMNVDDALLRLVREYAPFYGVAYQGRMTPALRSAAVALFEKVLPSYEALMKGENITQNLEIFADGCMEMKLYEYAIYSYRLLLFQDPSKGFDKKIINKINNCLDNLNVQESKEFLKSLLEFLPEYIKKLSKQ
jgi:tetratricopeptide (TPR) repeat protein